MILIRSCLIIGYLLTIELYVLRFVFPIVFLYFLHLSSIPSLSLIKVSRVGIDYSLTTMTASREPWPTSFLHLALSLLVWKGGSEGVRWWECGRSSIFILMHVEVYSARRVLDSFANSNQLDPLNPENWYQMIKSNQLLSAAKVTSFTRHIATPLFLLFRNCQWLSFVVPFPIRLINCVGNRVIGTIQRWHAQTVEDSIPQHCFWCI